MLDSGLDVSLQWNFWKPIFKSLDYLSSGLRIKTSSDTFHVFVKLVLGIFDLPAKAVVLNAIQYNVKYGCSICVHPGLRLPNNTRIYSPRKYTEQTHHDVMRNAETAER